MIKSILGKSKPLAATLVATKHLSFPSLKLLKTTSLNFY